MANTTMTLDALCLILGVFAPTTHPWAHLWLAIEGGLYVHRLENRAYPNALTVGAIRARWRLPALVLLVLVVLLTALDVLVEALGSGLSG
jgi:hypothetical protein